MVVLEGKGMKKLGDEISKTVNIGNDKRQFIVRIPKKISDQSILTDYEKEYIGIIKINVKDKKKIIIELEEKK